MGWECGAYGWGEGVCIRSCWGNRRKGDHWGDLGVYGWIMLEWISRRWDVGIWNTFVFREMRGISLLAAKQLASQEGLCTME